VNRSRMRAPVGLAVCGLAAGLVLAGCGAGQITQMSTMEAAVNGTSAIANNIALRNVHLRAPQSGDFLEPGHNVELLLVTANGSPDTPDKLLGITSDIGTVTVTGDGTIPANGVLVVGTPDGQPTPLDNVEPAAATKATVALAEPITNGLTYTFTFTFEKNGQATLAVPISAGEAPQRGVAPDAASGPAGHS
jgi:hypothetical protein